MNKEKFVLTIKAENRPCLLHLVTGVLNRKLIPIKSLTAAPTDVRDIVLITMEIELSDKALQPLLHKLENIIEVFRVDAIPADVAIAQCAAYFLMDKDVLSSHLTATIRKHELQMCGVKDKNVLFAKSGNPEILQRIYRDLDGAFMLGFSQTAPIADSVLIAHGKREQSVISRLTA